MEPCHYIVMEASRLLLLKVEVIHCIEMVNGEGLTSHLELGV